MRNALLFLLLPLLLQVGCGPSAIETDRKVIVLGFDGADPDLLNQWMNEGYLPNIQKLARTGTVSGLGTTNPPESPVAWASFSTGVNPGKHGIFDFLKRDPQTYFPDIGIVKREKPKFLFKLIPIVPPKIENLRHGVPFWTILGRHGVGSVNLRMPLTSPPDEVPNGKLLSGLGVPDVRLTWGTFFYFASDLSNWDVGNTEFGGKLVRLELEDNRTDTEIEGPPDPTADSFTRVRVPLGLHIEEDSSLTIQLQGQQERVPESSWSPWMEVEFKITPFVKVKAIGRFYVLETFPELRLYLTPLSFHPADSPLPLSYPDDYASELFKEVGYFKTLGWAHDTWALNEERIPEKVFLEDMVDSMSKLSEMLLHELETDPKPVTVAVFTATDSVSHMFFRLLDTKHPRYDAELAAKYGHAIRDTYQRMDDIIGRVMKFVDERTTLLVVSDHGFHSWRKEFNTNTWLVRNGFMTLKGMEVGKDKKILDDLFSGGSFFTNVDWSRTKAYALGLGQIYINLRGREREGIVEPGRDYEEVRKQIAAKLMTFRDPDTGEEVIQGAYPREKIFHGPYTTEAGDLQLTFYSGYRTSWQTSLGGVPEHIVLANLKKWSGDHCASDPSDTAGIFISNRSVAPGARSIIDIAPTVLKLFDIPIPKDMDGRPLPILGN